MLGYATFGSSVSLRSFARLGSNISVLDIASFGSSVSLRNFARLASSVSVMGVCHFGSVKALSVIQFANFGSSVSLRSKCKLGSNLSVLCIAQFGRYLKMNAFFKKMHSFFKKCNPKPRYKCRNAFISVHPHIIQHALAARRVTPGIQSVRRPLHAAGYYISTSCKVFL